MQSVMNYQLVPNDDQIVALQELGRDNAELCNWLADIVRGYSTEDKILSVEVARPAILGLPELNERTESGDKIIPSRYCWLALTRVIANLRRDMNKGYITDDYVTLDNLLATPALVKKLNQPLAHTMGIKLFRSAEKVRLHIPFVDGGEVTGFEWLPIGSSILVQDRGIWRVIAAYDDGEVDMKEDDEDEEWFVQSRAWLNHNHR